jgi:hypothetical protein
MVVLTDLSKSSGWKCFDILCFSYLSLLRQGFSVPAPCPRTDVLKLQGVLPGGLFVLRGAQVDCMRNIFIVNEIWLQGKIYILIGTLLG